MNRRIFLAGAVASTIPATAHAVSPVNISYLWTNAPSSGGNTLGALKGTLNFRINGAVSDTKLVSYGNGDGTGPYQCPELIKRYSALLGFPMTTTGDGRLAARNFANASLGGFVFVANGAPNLPKAGAVVSIEGWNTLPPGHVGIICNYSPADAATGRVDIILFDQNMPTSTWKKVTFTLTDGKWYGNFVNNGIPRPVAGWANPAG